MSTSSPAGHPLDGQRIWITGGASGIGKTTAIRLAACGADVMASDIDAAGLAALASTMPSIETQVLDMRRSTDVARVAHEWLERKGGIDVLVNCAGINVPQRHFDTMSIETWDAIVSVNLSGPFYACQAVLPQMRKAGHGTIINIASWAGRYPALFTGPAYNASKRAVIALTETINIEACRDGVRASSILPEEVNTPIVDKRPVPPSAAQRERMLQPDDVAAAIEFIAALPSRVCINELLISPTWNRSYLGGHAPADTIAPSPS
jgi:NAD(P)-dependent dehydrogenase (short-subunit alcohol dehydrogenase family)